MHRTSDFAKLIGLYSGATEEERAEAMKLAGDEEFMRSANNLNIKGREDMERARGTNLALTTRDLRDIARDAHSRGLNRQLLPSQFKLLDPRGTHILTPQFLHDKADGKPVDEHMRFHAHIKLIGKHKAVERMLDVSMAFVNDLYTDEEWDELREKSIALRSISEGEVPNPLADASAEGNA